MNFKVKEPQKRSLIKKLGVFTLLILLASLTSYGLHWQKTEQELSDQVGHLLMIGLNNRNFFQVQKMAEARLIDAVVVFGTTYADVEELQFEIKEIKTASRFPLIFAMDVEGGKVNRLINAEVEPLPSAEIMGQRGDMFTYQVAQKIASQLKLAGINLNLAPVVDLNINSKSPAIGALGRSFSRDPQVVLARAQQFIAAHSKEQIHTTLKHFPGHGSARADTHFGLTDITDT